MRTVIIGDIHGCDQKFHPLLDKTQPAAENRLILLGDLFDRGSESCKVLSMSRTIVFSTLENICQSW